MPGVGGDHKAAFELAQQRLFPHDAQDPLGIDHPALTAQGVSDAAVAVAREVQHDALDRLPQRHRLGVRLRRSRRAYHQLRLRPSSGHSRRTDNAGVARQISAISACRSARPCC